MPRYDYTQLEGKEVLYTVSGDDIIGIVSGCDYDIGITIQAKDDKTHYLLCLVSPLTYKGKEDYPKAEYRKLFLSVIKAIKKGVFEINSIVTAQEITADIGHRPSAKGCPFNQ